MTLNVYGEVIACRREIAIAELETEISQMVHEIGTTGMVAKLKGLDQELSRAIPVG